MRIRAYSFTPRLVPTLAAAAMIALTLALGRWQTERAQEKEAKQALYEARLREPPVLLSGANSSAEPLLYRRARASGRWIAEGQIFIDNQIHEGRAGFHVVTPLRLEGTPRVVLVNRGWIERTRAYPQAPAVEVPAGNIALTGLATVPPTRVLELSTDTVAGNVWQNLSIERYQRQSGLSVLPIVILADISADGLAAIDEKPDTGIAKHREYALTWFSLAATVMALWVGLNVRKNR
ncbi:MAG TPA: SURF1 family protein [Usitatibacter sp.]|nr:SURF1 family protein [Usitatibacter sp.]